MTKRLWWIVLFFAWWVAIALIMLVIPDFLVATYEYNKYTFDLDWTRWLYQAASFLVFIVFPIYIVWYSASATFSYFKEGAA